MKLNRKLILVLALVLSVAMATSGTLAYLTDRDSEANVFTFGDVKINLNEKFEQNAMLIPGVKIDKQPTITNSGKNDAWVWLTFSVPAALDNLVSGTDAGSDNNNIHWNPKGATTEGYVTEDRVAAAKESGFFADHLEQSEIDKLTADYINTNKMHWNVFHSLGEKQNVYQEEIEGILYNTYVLLYNKALTPGETTLPNIDKVYLDPRIDIDTNGDLYRVVNGEVSNVGWNINTNGNPVIHVSAYGIQKDTFATVNEAYKAYTAQWGTPAGIEHVDLVSTFEELKAAFTKSGNVKLMADIEWTENLELTNQHIKLDMNGKTITDTSNGETIWVRGDASLTITGNGTFTKTDHSQNMFYVDGTMKIMNGTFEYSDWIWGAGDSHDCDSHNKAITNVFNTGCMFVARSGIHKTHGYKMIGDVSIYGGTYDPGFKDPENFTYNGKSVVLYQLLNISETYKTDDCIVYGGTFISANPADGDSNGTSLFLKDQTVKGVVPSPEYVIKDTTLADGRTAYTVTYNGN